MSGLAVNEINDVQRLAALASYDILDTPPEEGFDDIVKLARQLCAVPVALISLVAADRQWFKARSGFPSCETDLNSSVCAHALTGPEILIIPDLTRDSRALANPLVTGEPYIRFYAGAPLRTGGGLVLGTLCVIDTVPRPEGLTPDQADALEALARQVMAQMNLHRAMGRSDTALLASKARQNVVFDVTKQLMGVMSHDGNLLEANRAALEAIGADRADVIGRPFWLTPWFTGTPGMSDMVKSAVEVARNGTPVQTEMALRLPDGTTRIYAFAMNPIRDEAGQVVEIMPEATDITALRQAEEALRQSQKMEAVGQLTGGLAHDFNNLLTGISGSLDMLGKRVAQGRINDLERYIIAAQGASKRAAALTHRLLAFSRRQTLDPKPTNVNRLVHGMADLIRRTVGPAITVETVDMVGLWAALVDPSQLENALLNLAINARDAMPDGGRITIETANRWIDDRGARERDLPPGQYLSLCVSDTGTGMPPNVIARAFDPFFTTKPLGMGTGLGLSMIYGFARQSGGQVRIYSELGAGSMVCIYLPRHYGVEDISENLAVRSEPQRAETGETVLVVDDEPTVRMLVCDVLSDLGYGAVEAEDGPSGLKVLQGAARVDLLITDVGLPNGMNGRQVADAARAMRPDLKVLFITGYAENAAVGNGHLGPGMAVLTKPFAMDDLATKIRVLIEG